MRFKIKNCLTAFRNLIKSLMCCNSSCCVQKIEYLSDENIQKLQELQDKLESIIGDVNSLKQLSPVASVSNSDDDSDKEPVFV